MLIPPTICFIFFGGGGIFGHMALLVVQVLGHIADMKVFGSNFKRARKSKKSTHPLSVKLSINKWQYIKIFGKKISYCFKC